MGEQEHERRSVDSVKKLLMGLMLLMTATAASAAWTLVGPNDDITLYVDRATIRRNGNFVKMWILFDYNKVDVTHQSSRSQDEFDCKGEKMHALAITSFSGQMLSGTVTYTNNTTGDWTPVAPESMGETMWKIACGKK